MEANIETNKNGIRTVNLLQSSENLQDQKHVLAKKKIKNSENNIILQVFSGKDKTIFIDNGFIKLINRIHI